MTTARWIPLPEALDDVPAEAGSYVLELELTQPIAICPGKLGTVRLDAGLVRYYGSARGSVLAKRARQLGSERVLVAGQVIE